MTRLLWLTKSIESDIMLKKHGPGLQQLFGGGGFHSVGSITPFEHFCLARPNLIEIMQLN
jgi:hypothetical protein